ncbi:unnamed protein product [Adineta steineri]|uniref:Uncharacterized protein n=1 Tax=Adineta steineri TaxID=433720 RepID=A0A815DX52_9BILA|nr:unnamed protein product [Adineta steineri]CAF3606809.1 unnamed protein product [Adineta steineri]
MSIHCRHEKKNQLPSNDEVNTKPVGYTHIIDSKFAPEKHFEPWNLSNISKNREYSSNNKITNKASRSEPLNQPSSSRNYGWNEIEQNEEEIERLRQLLPIWDAERIAILKLQHDLDKNIFKRTLDYIKRIGQSIGLGLWLWVHRPANCSNISNLYQQQQQRSPDLICSPCPDVLNESSLEKNYKQDYLIPSIDSLSESFWLKRLVLNEPQEYLPPIARAMKNMLDNNALVWNSEIQQESVWPHFINQYRMTQNKSFLRNLYGNNEYQTNFSQKLPSSSKHTTNEKNLDIPIMPTSTTGINKKSPRQLGTSVQQNTIIPSIHFTKKPIKQKQPPNEVTISQSVDNQPVLKPHASSLTKDQHKNMKQKQDSKKKR